MHGPRPIRGGLAGEQGRDVFAIPGSIHSPFSKGPHKLIREGAKLVETAQDVLAELGGVAVGTYADANTSTNDGVREPKQAALLDAIAHDPVDIDTLMARTQMPADEVQVALTALELDGKIAPLAGERWQRVDRAPISRTRA